MPRAASAAAAKPPGIGERRAVRERPCGNANFLVDLGGGDARAPQAGFAEVVLPDFVVPAQRRRRAATAGAAPPRPYLVLRRGVTGSLDLYDWWRRTCARRAPWRRTVTVALLAEDHETVVVRWRFRNARPVSLSYSPLNAADGGVLMETLELDFDAMEMA